MTFQWFCKEIDDDVIFDYAKEPLQYVPHINDTFTPANVNVSNTQHLLNRMDSSYNAVSTGSIGPNKSDEGKGLMHNSNFGKLGLQKTNSYFASLFI